MTVCFYRNNRTKDNLKTNGIMACPGENYVFVDHEHPIVSETVRLLIRPPF